MSGQLIGAAASFKDLSSRGIQHESLNHVVFPGSSWSGDAEFRAPSVRCALVAENTPNGLCNTLLHKASGVVPGVGARARPSQEENELELSKCAKIAGAAATDGSTADTIKLLDVHDSELSKSASFAGLTATAALTAGTIGLLEVHESEFSEVARTGESVGIIGLRQVMESDVARLSLIHESSLARSCADVGAFGAGVSVSGSAAPCVAALPADRALTYARVAANACGEEASACNSGSLDTVNLLRVQHSTSYNLQGVVAPDSRRKVRRSCPFRNRSAENMSPVVAAGTYRRSASTVHVQRQVSRNRLAGTSGVGAGPGPDPGGRSGLVGGVPGLAAACLEIPCSLVVPPGRHQIAPQSLA